MACACYGRRDGTHVINILCRCMQATRPAAAQRNTLTTKGYDHKTPIRTSFAGNTPRGCAAYTCRAAHWEPRSTAGQAACSGPSQPSRKRT